MARRTRAERTRSTFAIVGECSGKIRSTPCPNETLRTVNDARAPPVIALQCGAKRLAVIGAEGCQDLTRLLLEVTEQCLLEPHVRIDE